MKLFDMIRQGKLKLFNGKRERAGEKQSFVVSFSKAITIVWLILFSEVLLFSELATTFGFGDTMAIQFINDTIKEIGTIVCGAYFTSKTFENIARGIEGYKICMAEMADNADKDTEPVEE